jgi:ABC-type transporter Mla subunit MlaD
MPKKIKPFQLGLFFLASVIIAVGALIWVGAAHFFESGKMYVTYFKSSIGGLSPGAAVNYLGIQVGRVTSVDIAPDKKLIQVEMKLRPDFDVKGMSVALSQNGIMGSVFLGINKAPAHISQLTPKINFAHKYPLIPSHPGKLSRIEAGLEKFISKVETIDLKGLVAAWEQTGKNASALMKDREIRETINNLQAISADIKNLVQVLGKPGTPQKFQTSFANLAATAEAARASTEALAKRLQQIPPEAIPEITRQVQSALFQVSQVLTNIKGLVHEMRETPGKILVAPKAEEPFKE